MYSREDTKAFLAQRVARPASAGVIIENNAGEALVLKAHYKPYWSFPGGWIEHGQTPRQAALRELAEETGIEVSESDLKLAFVVDRTSNIMETYQFMFQAFDRKVQPDEIVIQATEIADYKFVTKEYVIKHANEFGGAVVAWAETSDTRYYEQTIE